MDRKARKMMTAILICVMTLALTVGTNDIIGMLGIHAVTVQAISSGGGYSPGAEIPAEFSSYKSEKKTVVEGMSNEGDSADSLALIAKAISAIDALQYDSGKSLAQNKAAVDSIVSELETALEAQRAADSRVAEILAEFSSYKSEKTTAVESMAKIDDSADSKTLIANAMAAIDALQYDLGKSLAQNKADVDSIVSELETALEAQRAADTKEAEDTAAANTVTERIISLPASYRITPGDRAMIEAARAAYDALTEDQKSKVTKEALKILIDAEEALKAAEEDAKKAEEARRVEEASAKKVAEEKAAAEQAEWNGVLTTSIPAAKSVKAKTSKKKVTISWKKLDKKKLKKYSKIEIQVCPDTGFAKANTIRKEVGKKKKSVKIGGLASKGVYYVRVRNVQGSGVGKTVSKWSKPKKVKIK